MIIVDFLYRFLMYVIEVGVRESINVALIRAPEGEIVSRIDDDRIQLFRRHKENFRIAVKTSQGISQSKS